MISLKVRDVYRSGMYSLVVNKDMPVVDVIKGMIENPIYRGIFVVDEKNQLMGVITQRDLIVWAKLMSGILPAKDVEDISKVMRLSLSKTAGGLVRQETKNAAVELDDSINDALDKMISLEVMGVPVVDKRGKVIGDSKYSKF